MTKFTVSKTHVTCPLNNTGITNAHRQIWLPKEEENLTKKLYKNIYLNYKRIFQVEDRL